MLCLHSDDYFLIAFVTLKVRLEVGRTRRNFRSILMRESMRARTIRSIVDSVLVQPPFPVLA
jgi:hypothetical protein